MNNSDLVKIILWKNSGFSESVWALKTQKENVFEINNVPFYDYAVSLGDLVRAAPVGNGVYEFKWVQTRGWHSTLRILWKVPPPDVDDFFSKVWLGSTSSIETDGKLFAVDISKEDSHRLKWLISKLNNMEEEWLLNYEEWFIPGGFLWIEL